MKDAENVVIWNRCATCEALEAHTEEARQLVEEALHLRTHGERAPGGSETWGAWETKAEAFLRDRSAP